MKQSAINKVRVAGSVGRSRDGLRYDLQRWISGCLPLGLSHYSVGPNCVNFAVYGLKFTMVAAGDELPDLHPPIFARATEIVDDKPVVIPPMLHLRSPLEHEHGYRQQSNGHDQDQSHFLFHGTTSSLGYCTKNMGAGQLKIRKAA